MREMGQSAWLSTSYPPYRAQSEESMRGRQELAVTTGYHGAIIILSDQSSAEGRHTSGEESGSRFVPCCDFPALLLQVIIHTHAGFFAEMMTQRRSAKTNSSRVTISPV